MTKLRYWFLAYLAVMLLFLGLIGYGFNGMDADGRDMVFYYGQRAQAERALQNGEDRACVEQEYGCRILLFSDEDYAIGLGDAYQKEALIMDLACETAAVRAEAETVGAEAETAEAEAETVGQEADTAVQESVLGSGSESAWIGKIVWDTKESHYRNMERMLLWRIVLLWGLLFAGGCLLFLFFYMRFIRPFRRLQTFAGQIAAGNLDIPLPMKKHQYFGAFTESFDLMREELKRAKESEYQANRSKKELVAELSHDIKTPIATIRATCEVLKMKELNPDIRAKVAVIDAKADMVGALAGNLFQASLEELEVLKVEPVYEQSPCIRGMFEEFNGYSEIHIVGEVPSCLVWMDRLRLRQVIDNLVSNSLKYAGTPVTVSFYETEQILGIRIRDEGEDVDEDELLLLSEKYYRGKNAKGKSGSGLGLYLAKLFMERMYGGIEFYQDQGFVAELTLKKA